MTPERLEQIRALHKGFPIVFEMGELLDHVDELTRQLSDARDKAINAEIFTSEDGDLSRYTHALNTETCERCGCVFPLDNGCCYECETETSTPGATSYKP